MADYLVNHLTRMQHGHVCVAALNRKLKHVRPLWNGSWGRSHLAPGGPFEIGAVVAIPGMRKCGSPPEVEDARIIDSARVTSRGRLPPEKFWSYIKAACSSNLRSVFGGALTRNTNGRAFTAVGTGTHSLGCIQPRRCELVLHGTKAARVLLHYEQLGDLDLSLTDVRLYDEANRVIQASARLVAMRLAQGEPTILSVGLTRPFVAGGTTEPRHWLQVNNVHFETYFDDHPVFAQQKTFPPSSEPPHGEPDHACQDSEQLRADLREWRRLRSQQDKVPAYVVFANAALDAIVRQQPRTLEALMQVPGIGAKRLDRYGGEIIALVESWMLSGGTR